MYKPQNIINNYRIQKRIYEILSLSFETKDLELKVNKTPFINNYIKKQQEIETEFSNGIENIGEYKYNKIQWNNLNNANKHIVRTFNDPLDIYEMLDIHKILFQGSVEAGILKKHDNAIAGFSTSKPSDTQNDLVKIVSHYWSHNSGIMESKLINAIILTLNFLIVHPFQDGNGRMSRLLMHKLIIKSGLAFIKYQSLSQYIHKTKSDYYDSLEQVRRGLFNNPGEFDNDNCIAYVEYILGVIIEAIKELKNQFALYDRVKKNTDFKKWIMSEVAASHKLKREYFYTKLSLVFSKDKIKRIVLEMINDSLLKTEGHYLKINF